MADQSDIFTDALRQAGNQWDTIQNAPTFKQLSDQQQSDLRHFYYTKHIVGNPVISKGLASDPSLAPMLHHGFFDQETQAFDKKAAAVQQPWYSTPVPQMLFGSGATADALVDQQEHPYLHGVAKFAEGMTTPTQLGILGATWGMGGLIGAGAKLAGMAPELIPAVTRTIQGVVDMGFGADMLHGAYKEYPQIKHLMDLSHKAEFEGDEQAHQQYSNELKSELVQLGLGGAFTGLAIRAGVKNLRGGVGEAADVRRASATEVPPSSQGPTPEPKPQPTAPVDPDAASKAKLAEWAKLGQNAETKAAPEPKPEVQLKPTPEGPKVVGSKPAKPIAEAPSSPVATSPATRLTPTPTESAEAPKGRFESVQQTEAESRDFQTYLQSPEYKASLAKESKENPLVQTEPEEFAKALKASGLSAPEAAFEHAKQYPSRPSELIKRDIKKAYGMEEPPETTPTPKPPAPKSPVPELPEIQKFKGGALNVMDPDARATIDRDLEAKGLATPSSKPKGSLEGALFSSYKEADSAGKESHGPGNYQVISRTTVQGETKYRVEAAKGSVGASPSTAPKTSSTPPPKPSAASEAAQTAGESVPPAKETEVTPAKDKIAEAVPSEHQFAFRKIHDSIQTAIGGVHPDVKSAVLDKAYNTYKEHIAAGDKPTEALRQAMDVVRIAAGQKGVLSFRKLTPEEKKPAEPGPIDRLLFAFDKAINPSSEKQTAMNIIRWRGAQLMAQHEAVLNKLKDHIKSHDGDGPTELRSFMDAAEGKPGAEFSSKEDEALAGELKGMFQDRWQKYRDLLDREGKEDPGEGIANYLKHLFTGPQGQNKAAQILFGKRPLEGPKTFLKHRFYEYLSDGLDAGLDPVTYNPINMQLMGLFEIDRYLMAHDMKNDMRTNGLIKFFGLSGKDRPADWVRINDKIFQPRLMKEGGLVEYGNYYAPRDAAKIFNNYLSPGLRGNWQYDLVRKYGNILNQVQLGMSAFHATFTTVDSSISDMALGIQKAFNQRDFGSASKLMGRSLVPGWSAAHAFKIGKLMEAEIREPGSHPEVQAFTDAMKLGGGRMGIDPIYENHAVEEFRKQWNTNKFSFSTPLKGLEALTEWSSRWIMKNYVPRLKLGIFSAMAENRLGELIKTDRLDLDTVQTELGKIWDSVDNRMGQLVYDNLFWHKTAKDLGFLSVRSMGWNLGTIREIGGGGLDVYRQMRNWQTGKAKPEFTQRMAYTAALPIIAGTIGAMYGYASGNPPQKLEDYFFPKTGGVGSDGRPERVSIPTYMKDISAYYHHPADTLLHKLHPALQELTELYQNRDYYGTEIRQSDDPIMKQALQVGGYMGKQLMPFGARNIIQRRGAGESWPRSLESEVGIVPAPKYIGQTKAEEMAGEFAQRHYEAGPHTSETAQTRQNFSKIRSQFIAGKLPHDKLAQAMKEGRISPAQVDTLFDEQGMSSLERNFSRLTPDESLRVWMHSSPSEKAQLKPMMYDKVDRIENLPEDQQKDLYGRFREALTGQHN